MNGAALVSRTLWHRIGSDLRGGAFKWWTRHESALTSLTRDEMLALANNLRAGDRRGARDAMVRHFVALGPGHPDWASYVDLTSDQIRDLAARRAAFIEAIGELGWWAARAISKAILAAVVA